MKRSREKSYGMIILLLLSCTTIRAVVSALLSKEHAYATRILSLWTTDKQQDDIV